MAIIFYQFYYIFFFNFHNLTLLIQSVKNVQEKKEGFHIIQIITEAIFYHLNLNKKSKKYKLQLKKT